MSGLKVSVTWALAFALFYVQVLFSMDYGFGYGWIVAPFTFSMGFVATRMTTVYMRGKEELPSCRRDGHSYGHILTGPQGDYVVCRNCGRTSGVIELMEER